MLTQKFTFPFINIDISTQILRYTLEMSLD